MNTHSHVSLFVYAECDEDISHRDVVSGHLARDILLEHRQILTCRVTSLSSRWLLSS